MDEIDEMFACLAELTRDGFSTYKATYTQMKRDGDYLGMIGVINRFTEAVVRINLIINPIKANLASYRRRRSDLAADWKAERCFLATIMKLGDMRIPNAYAINPECFMVDDYRRIYEVLQKLDRGRVDICPITAQAAMKFHEEELGDYWIDVINRIIEDSIDVDIHAGCRYMLKLQMLRSMTIEMGGK